MARYRTVLNGTTYEGGSQDELNAKVAAAPKNPSTIFQYAFDMNAINRMRAEDTAMNAADAAVDLQTAQDTAAASKAAADRWNSNALMQGRRRAGGSTYRRRGTVFSGASGLDKANIASLADARRKKARADVEQQQLQQFGGQNFGVTIGAPITLW